MKIRTTTNNHILYLDNIKICITLVYKHNKVKWKSFARTTTNNDILFTKQVGQVGCLHVLVFPSKRTYERK